MLMQNFMSATDLGLTEAEYQALITTLGMMERGEIKHVNTPDDDELDEDEVVFSGLFNLGEWSSPFDCGTVACIGGTAELVGKLPRQSLDEKCNALPELGLLCYPPWPTNYDTITVEQAAKALRSYLTTGKANWDEALA